MLPGRWVIALALLGDGAVLQAQSLRDYDYSRPFRGEGRLRAEIAFAAGKLMLGAPASDRLYGMALQYDAERFEPVGSYDAADNVVRLGVEGSGRGGIRVGMKRALPQTAVVEFSRAVDLYLDLSLGAAEADLDLGGYRLSGLELKSGASRVGVSFSKPNPLSCNSASVSSGAGEVTVEHLGNSGCRVWRFDGGVGSVTIGLDGAWPADAVIQLNMALGGVTLQAPKDLGMRVTLNGFLASFDGKGFSKSGKTYTSAGYDAGSRKVSIEISSALGGVKVEWKQ